MRRVVLALVLAFILGVAGCDEDGSVPTPTGSQSVDLSTEDGLTLRGYLFGTGNVGVILSHMYPADQTSWYDAARRLADEGYLVLTFDFRGYGESGGDKDIELLAKDVFAATQAMRAAGATDMVLVGASMGGTASLIAAENTQLLSSLRVLGVVTLSAPVEFKGLDAAQAVPRLISPLLFMAAEADVGAAGARELQELAGEQGEVGIVPGDEHGTDLLTGQAADQVWNLLLQFLRQNLPVSGR